VPQLIGVTWQQRANPKGQNPTQDEISELVPINSFSPGGKGKHTDSSKGAADPAYVVICDSSPSLRAI